MTTLFDPPKQPGEIRLRPYQEQAASAVDAARARGLRSGLIVLATGGGKTTIFSHLIGQEAKRGGRSLILAHRDELVEQAADRIKPVDLMRWLVRLVCPPGGVVLDPYTGSGTTGVACRLEGFGFIGIELNPEYIELARQRINAETPSLFCEVSP